MASPLHLLMLEDSEDDADLILMELRHAGFEPDCMKVQTERGFIGALDMDYDVIIADYRLPSFSALQALQLARQKRPEIPFVVATGTLREELTIDLVKQGAFDYVLKDRLGRLGLVVERALEQKRAKGQRQKAELAERRAREELQAQVEMLTRRIADLESLNRSLQQRLGEQNGARGGVP